LKSLQPYHTFKTHHQASHLEVATTIDELRDYLTTHSNPLILGEGSNVLFTKDVSRAVIVIDIKGIEVIKSTETYQDIKVAAGENWHEFVLWCLEHDLGGIENLSLIPGKCGAAPIQNIGAYGVELADVLTSVTCIDKNTQAKFTLDKSRCKFGYRDSIFKNDYRDQYVITSITVRLTTKGHHKKNFSYGAIKEVLQSWRIEVPTIKDISAAVIKIRQSKLPDPKQIPNAGSFFKNPVIDKVTFESIKELFPNIPSYPVDQRSVKVPAGWLIDQCGWKGVMLDMVGVHSQQALVLVNHGESDGQKIKGLSRLIQKKVSETYGIDLQTEVNVI